ncbi:MAG TPA: carboxypeptidase regulatory-like domain-containing protein [Bryobacteraceae bacterium]|nr:carboxypeptidase regulatory-like domain-containing protein [Bryobacteraceae bacterium]
MRRILPLLLVDLSLLLPILVGQSQNGRLGGRVTDQSGAIIPNVDINVVEQDTGTAYKAKSNEAGVYLISFLPPGRYTIEASATAGFKEYRRENLALGTSEEITADIVLELGGVNEKVIVSDVAPLLSMTSDVGQLIESTSVTDMPVANRRAMSLIPLLAGGIMVSYDVSGKPNFALSGARMKSQMYWLDGGENQNVRYGQAALDIDPSTETVREVQVLQNTYSAEFGGSAGGVIVMTTKSGTNELHGSAFEYFRNSAIAALPFGALTMAPLQYNQFGGTVGGPIRKNKTHFFVGYEGTRNHAGQVSQLTVPTVLQRQGDFSQTTTASGTLIPIYDPLTNTVVNGKNVRTAFPNNVIPPQRLDAVGIKIIPFYPLPNRAPANAAGANNFVGNYSNIYTRDNVTVKIDHNFSDRNHFYYRLIYMPEPSSFTSVFPNPIADTNLGNPTRRETSNLWSDTITLRPDIVTDIRVSLATRRGINDTPGFGSNAIQLLGLKNVPTGAFPLITVSGITNLGNATQYVNQDPIRHQQGVNSWTWVKGKHVVKFGGEFRRSANTYDSRPSISGQFGFSTQGTSLQGVANTGVGVASMLVGWPDSYYLETDQLAYRLGYYMAGYIQDDWKVTPSFTLNLGVRWETDTPMVDGSNRMNGFDMQAVNPVSGTPGVVTFAGVNGWPTNPYETNWKTFGPRFGFAWQPLGDQKTVVRGGFGIYYAPPFDRGALTNALLGFSQTLSLTTPNNGVTAPFILQDGPSSDNLSSTALTPAYGAVRVGANPTTNVEFFERNRPTGYAQMFNFGIRRELVGNVVLDVSYVANLSRHIGMASVNINQIRPESVSAIQQAGVFTQAYRPFPQFNSVTDLFPPMGVIDYHSLVVKFEKRFSHGLNFLGTYTWSKNLSNEDDCGSCAYGSDQQYSNYYNRQVDKGPDSLDFRHRLTWSSVYDVPVGTNRRWLKSGLLSRIVGGWTIGAIFTAQTGGPFTVTTQTNTTFVFSAGAQRANVVASCAAANPTASRWFNTDAFVTPASYTFGNAGRGICRADGQVNLDSSIVKDVHFTEAKYLELRAEVFNTLNHFDYRVPGTSLGSASFGVVSAGSNPRILQLAARFVF